MGGWVRKREHAGGDCRAPEGASSCSAWDGSTGGKTKYNGFAQISQVEKLLEEGKETRGALTRQASTEIDIYSRHIL